MRSKTPPKRVEHQIAGLVERDERAAFGHEALQRIHARIADAALVLRRHRVRRAVAPGRRRSRVAAHDPVGRLVRQDDDVEARAQIACPDVAVGKRRVRERVLLEKPPRPALVHVGDPAFVQADAARADGDGGLCGSAVERPGAETEIPNLRAHDGHQILLACGVPHDCSHVSSHAGSCVGSCSRSCAFAPGGPAAVGPTHPPPRRPAPDPRRDAG